MLFILNHYVSNNKLTRFIFDNNSKKYIFIGESSHINELLQHQTGRKGYNIEATDAILHNFRYFMQQFRSGL
jgi:hypothetical protein